LLLHTQAQKGIAIELEDTCRIDAYIVPAGSPFTVHELRLNTTARADTNKSILFPFANYSDYFSRSRHIRLTSQKQIFFANSTLFYHKKSTKKKLK
jgi:hypothetical protein